MSMVNLWSDSKVELADCIPGYDPPLKSNDEIASSIKNTLQQYRKYKQIQKEKKKVTD